MDEKILEALSDIGSAIEKLTESLKNKDKAKSDSGKFLQSADLGKTLDLLSKEIKSIKSDTQQILKNQETLLKISKDKSSKTEVFETSGTKKSKIKDGVGTVLMIAAGVLAIGLAFKIVGQVDFLSVIALSIALPLVAFAFEKIANMKDLNSSDKKNLFLTTVTIAASITAASMIMQYIRPISFSQGLTAILIAGTFAIIGFSIDKIAKGVKDVKPTDLIKMPLVLFSVGLSIALASQVMRLIHPISFTQGLTAILIAGTFAVIGYSIDKITKGVKDVTAKQLIMVPLVLVAFATAITLSSIIMQGIIPIKYDKFLTAIGISVAFAIMSVSMPLLAMAVEKIGIERALLLPLILPVMGAAIMLASYPLSKTENIDSGLLFNIVLQSITLAIMGVALGAATYVLAKVGLDAILEGSIALIALAGVMYLSSKILSEGSYDVFPSFSWAAGVGLSLLAFGLAALGLGMAIELSGGLAAGALLLGAGAVLGLAYVMVKASEILNTGVYGNFPSPDWAMGVGLSLAAFGLGVLTLGTFMLVTFGLGKKALDKGAEAITIISNSIVDSAAILSKGNFTGGPTEDWARGVSTAISAFAPVFPALSGKGILSLFSSGPTPEQFNQAIITISNGIVAAAEFFAGKPSSLWQGGPSAEWAMGVGGAIGAFAPVFEALKNSSGLFGSGPTPEEMNEAMVNMSNSIVLVSNILATGNYGTAIPDGYIESLSNSIKTYVDLVQYVSNSDVDAFSVLNTLSVSYGLFKLAEGYNKLADSITKLGGSINGLDLQKLDSVNRLSGSIVLMSLMDEEQFGKMMDTLEEKAGIFVKVMNGIEGEKETSGFNLTKIKTGSSSDESNQQIISILNQISQNTGQTARYAKSFSDYVSHLMSKPTTSTTQTKLIHQK